MTKDRYWREPKKARGKNCDAWWYANEKTIEIHAQHADFSGAHCVVILTRSQLEEYLKRSSLPQKDEA